MYESVVLPGRVAAQVITSLTEDNERLSGHVRAITEYRRIENETLSNMVVGVQEVREIHHWVRLLDGTEACSNCGPGYPCKTIVALNRGEEEAPHVDL